MSENQKKILNTFEEILPELSELEKEKLLSYGEGFAAGVRSRKGSKETKPERTD